MKADSLFHRLLRSAIRWLIFGASVVWLVGMILRLTVQDRFASLSVIFYGTPWMVLAMLGALPTSRWSARRQWQLTALGAMGVTFCVGGWARQNWFHHPESTETPALRALFRNAGYPYHHAWPGNIENLVRENADIVGLVEAGIINPANQERFRNAFPDHIVGFHANGLLLAVRGEVLESSQISLGPRSCCQVTRARVKGRLVTIILIDLDSNPFPSRRERFARLDAVLSAHAGETLLLMGDFNTPRESVYFRPWRKHLRHAFESAGRGLIDTWPAPMPILCIDNIWSTPDLRPLGCEKRCDELHDHCALVVEFAPAP